MNEGAASTGSDAHIASAQSAATLATVNRQQQELIDIGLALGDLGWTLVPVEPGTKRPWVEALLETHGATSWRAVSEPVSEDALQRWVEAAPGVGLAVRCGSASGGLVCVDYDEGLPRSLPRTPAERSPKGGHVYFHYPHRRSGRNHATGEVRAENQIVVIAPSPYYLGGRYKWITSPLEAPVAPLPEEFVELLERPPLRPRMGHAPTSARRFESPAPFTDEARGVEARHRMYLSSRPPKGAGVDRSSYEFGIAKDLLRAGLSPEDAMACFVRWWPQRHGEEYERLRNFDWTRRTIHAAELAVMREPVPPVPPNHVEGDSDTSRYGRVDTLEFLRMIRGQRVGELVAEVQAAFGVARSTATENKALAQDMGYVAVTSDPSDGRVKRVSLTAKGQALVASNSVRFPRGRAPHELRTYRQQARANRVADQGDAGFL